MDILLAPIPFKNIPESLNLTSYEDDEIINDNLNTLNKLIDKMMETDDIQYIKSILILTGYRYTYRAKFHLIHYSTRENFTLLLRAVKLWAKKKHIYSNIFGYLSGSILIVMVTKICLIYPFGEINFLLQQFFQIYGACCLLVKAIPKINNVPNMNYQAIRSWPLPLITEQMTLNILEDKFKNFKNFWTFDKLNSSEDGLFSGDKMPILTSLFPEQNTAHNVNEFTLKIILREMKKVKTISLIMIINRKTYRTLST
uniref:polynucleotide adenylyltransferase n=3 Tax=Meloidogyne TaxID=189290 RepID=A0A914MUU5_MELIC